MRMRTIMFPSIRYIQRRHSVGGCFVYIYKRGARCTPFPYLSVSRMCKCIKTLRTYTTQQHTLFIHPRFVLFFFFFLFLENIFICVLCACEKKVLLVDGPDSRVRHILTRTHTPLKYKIQYVFSMCICEKHKYAHIYIW